MARTKKVHHTQVQRLGPLRAIEMHGMRKGRGGNKNWLYVGTALWTLRTVRRMAERREEILISEQLKPGERIIISNARPTLDAVPVRPAAPKGRRARKAARKAEAKQAKLDAKAAARSAKRAARRSGRRSAPAAA